MVRDTSLKTDRLLTLVPLNRNCPLTACPSTKDILNNLFLALQHPYICPVFHVDFLEYEDQTYIVLVQPINQGSLKDLIYGVSFLCIEIYLALQTRMNKNIHILCKLYFRILFKLIFIYFFALLLVKFY